MFRQYRLVLVLLAFVLTALIESGCSRTPFTGRRQYNIIPNRVMLQLGRASYQEILGDSDLETGTNNHSILRRVGRRISGAANEPDYGWRYSLIDDDTINAWCLPGGKIGFYTGILPVLRNEAGMAFVMGHEVGHATAHHGAERLSQRLTVLGGLAGLSLYVDNRTELTDEQKALIVASIGAGAAVGVLLPFSRRHEREADVIGLMYMSKAGYPPEESVRVWDRMARQTRGVDVPTFLSTHPSHSQRQATLQEWMQRAQNRYERNRLGRDTQEVIWRR